MGSDQCSANDWIVHKYWVQFGSCILAENELECSRGHTLWMCQGNTNFVQLLLHWVLYWKAPQFQTDGAELFWSYHKAILRHRANLHHEITLDGVTTIKSAKDKATVQYTFQRVLLFRISSTYHRFKIRYLWSAPSVWNWGAFQYNTQCRRSCTKFMLQYLDTSKACGPDGIPTRLLQECSFQIAPSICELFNHSQNTGQIPSEWKYANVTPVHKKDPGLQITVGHRTMSD
jgi:hypothetical protein